MKKVLANDSAKKESNRQKEFPKKTPMLETNSNDFRFGMLVLTVATAGMILLNTCDSKGAKDVKSSEKKDIVAISIEAKNHSKEEEKKHSED